jgi:hypothetical protein
MQKSFYLVEAILVFQAWGGLLPALPLSPLGMPRNTCSFRKSGDPAVVLVLPYCKIQPENGSRVRPQAAHPAEENVLKRTKTGREEKEVKRSKSSIYCELSSDTSIQGHGIICRETKTVDH